MRALRHAVATSVVIAAAVTLARASAAQGEPPSTPPVYAPSPTAPPYAPAAPPAYVYTPPPPPPPAAPRFSLWTGGRIGILGFDDDFYENELGKPETTGNFVRTGIGVELDVGARLARRYIPYVGLEVGLHGAGHRFDGESAQAYSTFLGIGFRSVWVDIDPNVGLLTDLSFGYRTVTVTAGSDKYSMSAIELFRLGLGAEVRMSPVFTISPMITLSGGAMNDTSGSISFGPNGIGDGLTRPTYEDGTPIDRQRGYLVVNVGCGAHFDLFGR